MGCGTVAFGCCIQPSSVFKNKIVLGSARTGLIFTRIQEGTQPGGLTPPGQTEPGIPYHVPSCWVPMGGSWAGGTHSWQRRWAGRAALCVLLFWFVYSPYLYRCCYSSLLFTVLLNCPYPDPPVSACFFPFSSASQQGEGWPRGAFVAGRCQTITKVHKLSIIAG